MDPEEIDIAKLWQKMMLEKRCRICGSAPIEFAYSNGSDFYYCTHCGDRGNVYDLCIKQFGMNHAQAADYLEGIDKLPEGVKSNPFTSMGVSIINHTIDNIGCEQVIKIAQDRMKKRDKK